jgi:hypothetical protein
MNIPSHEEDRVRPNITKMGSRRRRKKRKQVNKFGYSSDSQSKGM